MTNHLTNIASRVSWACSSLRPLTGRNRQASIIRIAELRERAMPFVKLPSGEFVDPTQVKSVTCRSGYDDWYVDLNLKSGKTIAVACASDEDMQSVLERIGKLLGGKT